MKGVAVAVRILIVLALLVVPLDALHAKAGKPDAPRPDIVLLITDDMRGDDWRVLAQTTRLVGGTWFPNFVYTTPLCCPTRVTLLTGQYAHNHGITSNDPGWRAFRRRGERETIATALDRAGYHTVLVGKYMNLYDGSAVPPGWDRWLGHLAPRWEQTRPFYDDAVGDLAAREIASAPRDAPLFLVAGFRSPHAPHTPPQRYRDADVGPTRNEEDRERKRELLAVDDAVASIARAMGVRWADACVVVLSDNGFLLGEHDYTGKGTWWDEASRVPALIRCNGISGRQDTRLAASIDIAPTLLRAARATLRRDVDGRPLQRAWDRERILIESWTRGDPGDQSFSVFVGLKGKGWVYVEPAQREAGLYRTPGERRNLLPTLTGRERGEYAMWLDRLASCEGASCRAADGARGKKDGKGKEKRKKRR